MLKTILQNIAYLASSSIIAKGVLFIFYIYIAREFGPEKYGNITSSIEYIGLFLILSSFGFQMTIVREASKKELATDVHNKILPVRLILSGISFLLAISVALLLYKETVSFNLILVLSFMILIQPFEDYVYSIFWINQKLKFAAFGEMIKIAIYILIYFLLDFFLGLNELHFVIAVVLGFFCSFFYKYQRSKKIFNHKMSIIWDKAYAKKILSVSFYFGIVSIVYIYSLKIDYQMISVLSGEKEVGLYGVSWQILQIGVVFIQALSTSLFPNSMKKIHESSFRLNLLKILSLASLGLILVCLGVTLYSDIIIQLIYGDKYQSAEIILSILIWYLPIRLFGIWGSQILESGHWYKKRVFIYLLPLLVNIGLNMYYIPIGGAKSAAIIALFSNFLLIFTITIFAFIYSKKYFKNDIVS